VRRVLQYPSSCSSTKTSSSSQHTSSCCLGGCSTWNRALLTGFPHVWPYHKVHKFCPCTNIPLVHLHETRGTCLVSLSYEAFGLQDSFARLCRFSLLDCIVPSTHSACPSVGSLAEGHPSTDTTWAIQLPWTNCGSSSCGLGHQRLRWLSPDDSESLGHSP
jgi:hypothetical protein